MNMQEAADRLGKIIKKLGAGTSLEDQRELEVLHADMQDASATAHPKAKQRKARATATARQAKPSKSMDEIARPASAVKPKKAARSRKK